MLTPQKKVDGPSRKQLASSFREIYQPPLAIAGLKREVRNPDPIQSLEHSRRFGTLHQPGYSRQIAKALRLCWPRTCSPGLQRQIDTCHTYVQWRVLAICKCQARGRNLDSFNLIVRVGVGFFSRLSNQRKVETRRTGVNPQGFVWAENTMKDPVVGHLTTCGGSWCSRLIWRVGTGENRGYRQIGYRRRQRGRNVLDSRHAEQLCKYTVQGSLWEKLDSWKLDLRRILYILQR